MNVSKAASVLSVGRPDDEQLAKINRFSKTPLSAEKVYCFSVRLCDDLPDRDFERFDSAALPKLAELFRGKTGIVDHDWSSQNQIARIFDTEVCHEQGASYVRAWCYMLRTEKNTDLIADIEGGIKKEVSIGCAVGRVTCSLCGCGYGTCEHHKGSQYNGELCLAVLSEPVDAYEFSFVAVPAQKEAGVLKAKKGGVTLSLADFVEKSGDSALAESFRKLQKDALFGQKCREELVKKAVSLAVLLDFGGEEAVLTKAFSSLSGEDLNEITCSMERKAAQLFPPQTQLPSVPLSKPAMDADYMI